MLSYDKEVYVSYDTPPLNPQPIISVVSNAHLIVCFIVNRHRYSMVCYSYILAANEFSIGSNSSSGNDKYIAEEIK